MQTNNFFSRTTERANQAAANHIRNPGPTNIPSDNVESITNAPHIIQASGLEHRSISPAAFNDHYETTVYNNKRLVLGDLTCTNLVMSSLVNGQYVNQRMNIYIFNIKKE